MTNEAFQALLARGPVLLDGATGSNLMRAGMPRGICTEVGSQNIRSLCWLCSGTISRPGRRSSMRRRSAPTGAGLHAAARENDVALLNRQLVALSREAAGGRALVAGDLTTTGVPARACRDDDISRAV